MVVLLLLVVVALLLLGSSSCCLLVISKRLYFKSFSRLFGTRTSILIFVMSCNVILCHPESARNPSLIHAVLVK